MMGAAIKVSFLISIVVCVLSYLLMMDFPIALLHGFAFFVVNVILIYDPEEILNES